MSDSAFPTGDRLSQQPTGMGSRPGPVPAPSGEPAFIGPYRILEKRGEGGMGVVYLAEQTEPVRRVVALKVIKLGLDTLEVVTRFQAERQALAMMDHPAIASIFDAGATADGRPWFSMEYVEGEPITRHCDRHQLTTRERIELFQQVCEGVQHAHQKAVIHRDLKPSNVLVGLKEGRRAVKIIDFGLAKALEQPLTDRTLFTQFGAMVGTVEYMSPEQADPAGNDVDTRSDVYSLGVMLYEILTGTLPFGSRELRQADISEVRRTIRELDPPRPSLRLSMAGPKSGESAMLRRTEPKLLHRELVGDLDWITMRALEKDRARRYASPSELAADLGRYLRSEPVLARAPSAAYRASRFVRRHRLAVAAAAVVAASLAVGTVASVVGLVRAREAESRARTEAESKRRVADFLKDLFKVSDPGEARGSSITARELLDRAAGTLDARLADQPAVQAELAAIMGEVYMNLGLYGPAESLLERSLETRRRVLGPEARQTLESMTRLAACYLAASRSKEAMRIHREALEIQTRLLGPEHPDTLATIMNLANAHQREGDFAESERLYTRAFEAQGRILGPEHPGTLLSKYNRALVYLAQGRLDESERALSEVLEVRNRVPGPDHPETLNVLSMLGKVHSEQGRYEEAERELIRTLELSRRVLGPEHPATLSTMTDLALIHQGRGNFAEAARLSRETLEIQRRVLGPEHGMVLWSMNNLALAYQSEGRLDEAERLHLQTLEIRTRVLGPTNPDTLASIYNLACVYARRGERARALEWLRRDVEGGDIDADAMAADAELRSLHGPEFDALVDQARRNAMAARAGGTEPSGR